MTGHSTRAIRAATRAPRVEQRPTPAPIHQAATCSAAEAGVLGALVADRVGGRACDPLVAGSTPAVASPGA